MENHTNEKVISIGNEKGGTAKTTTSFITAGVLSQRGYKVLLIDFDPSATQTMLMGLDANNYKGENIHNIANIFEYKQIQPIQINENLYFIPSNDELTNKSHNPTIPGKDLILKKFVKSVREEYDYIIIDGPPNDIVLINNIAMAADILVIPVATSTLEEKKTPDFLEKINRVYQAYETAPKKICFAPVRYRANQKTDNAVLDVLNTDAVTFTKSLGSLVDVNVYTLNPLPERTAIANSMGEQKFLKDYIDDIYDSFSLKDKESHMRLLDIVNQMVSSIINHN